MTVPARLDHIVIAGPNLAELVAWFAALTGVTAQPGGKHPIGTQNALVALTLGGLRGQQYIELIGPAVDRSPTDPPTVFAIDTLTEPAVQAFAVHSADIVATVAAARAIGWDPGEVTELSRRTAEGELLEWRLTLGAAGERMRLDVPFLIDWGATPHPGETTVPELELVEFVRLEPSSVLAEERTRELAVLGEAAIEVRIADRSGYALTLRSAAGADTVIAV